MFNMRTERMRYSGIICNVHVGRALPGGIVGQMDAYIRLPYSRIPLYQVILLSETTCQFA